MNKKIIKILKGVFLSFIPLFAFVCFVYGSQLYLTSGSNIVVDIDSENFLASVSNDQGQNINKTDNILPVEDLSDTGEKIENKEIQEIEEKKQEVKSFVSTKIKLGFKDEVILEKDSNLVLPVASLTKLITAIICLENYNLSDEIIVSKVASLQPAMRVDIKEGDIFSVEELLKIMLIESSNRAAYALSEKMGEVNFISMMNKKVKEIGLKNSIFFDPTGLSSNNTSTAKDLVVLAKYILNNYSIILDITTRTNYNLEKLGTIINTNQLLWSTSNIVLGKTGFTNSAKGCLLIGLKDENDGSYIVNVVLGADDRFYEMKKLINLDVNNDNTNI